MGETAAETVNWLMITAAFLAGCAAVCCLEGWYKQRPLWVLLALLPTVGSVWLWSQTTLPSNHVPLVTAALVPATSTPDTPWTPRPPVVAIADYTPVPVAATPTITPLPIPPQLAIPSLGIEQTIVTVPIQDGEWNVSALGEQVGWLEGTGRVPATAGAPVLVGHMTYPDANLLAQGAFAYLQEIRLGAEVVYEVDGERYVYEVVEVGRIAPADVSALYAADGETLFLLTCTDWNDQSRVYENRLLVRAVRR